MRPLLCLNMIVRNESSVILRCLKSVENWVDGIFIADTGSTDDTIHKIEEWKNKNNKWGTVVKQDWKNFGHNRTLSLKGAQKWLSQNGFDLKNVYLVFLDADMCFEKGKELLPHLKEADLWFIYQENRIMKYQNLRIAKASISLEVKCPTHEYYDIQTKDIIKKTWEGEGIKDVGDGGCKQDKAQRDIRLLKEGLVEEPTNLRYWFYLANTFKDIGQYTNAIKAYQRRVQSTGWYEELYCAYLYKGDCHISLRQKEEAVYAWLNAYNADPFRPESLCRLAAFYRKDSKHHLSMLYIEKGLEVVEKKSRRMLFQEKPCYEYHLDYELSICAYYVGQRERGKKACERLLKRKDLPSILKKSVQDNSTFYI